MKTLGIFLIITGILFAVSRGIFHLYVQWQYEKEIENYWTLADRASTIVQKSEYLDKFVEVLEKQKLDGINDALFFPTDATDFTQNLKALKSLQGRLKTILKMDESSFEYQTAIQQITAQEQGEAREMLGVLQKCWTKDKYYTNWNPFFIIGFLILQIIMIGGGSLLAFEDY